MTPDEREQMFILCQRLADEKNRDKFSAYIENLDDLLEKKAERLGLAGRCNRRPIGSRTQTTQ